MSLTTGGGSRYTDEDRRNAAMRYALTGNLHAVERETGIPNQTLSDWKRSEWWEDTVQGARTLIEDQFRGRCHEIVDKATSEILDRLDNGNEVATKHGIQRIKPTAGELAKVGGIFYDKLRLSLNLPTSIAGSSGYKKAIDNLATQFRQLSEQYQEKRANSISGECEDLTNRPDNEQSDT